MEEFKVFQRLMNMMIQMGGTKMSLTIGGDIYAVYARPTGTVRFEKNGKAEEDPAGEPKVEGN